MLHTRILSSACKPAFYNEPAMPRKYEKTHRSFPLTIFFSANLNRVENLMVYILNFDFLHALPNKLIVFHEIIYRNFQVQEIANIQQLQNSQEDTWISTCWVRILLLC